MLGIVLKLEFPFLLGFKTHRNATFYSTMTKLEEFSDLGLRLVGLGIHRFVLPA